MQPRMIYASLTRITALMVVLMAVLAGGTLWAVRLLHRQAAHADAARSVLDQGRLIASYLAQQEPVCAEAGDWATFSRQVRALGSLENGLQYVSVAKDGVTVFHEQLTALGAGPDAGVPETPRGDVGRVRMTRKVLDVGASRVPVVVFAAQVHTADGKIATLEAALRRETVEREERTAAAAIASMFRVSLITVAASFAACAALVVWMMQREARRQRQRRAEEHLAFAGVLANGIVHDFRNPMSSVRLDVQLLEKEAAKGPACKLERMRELANRVRSTVDRMDKVFQEFLYLSRPTTGERQSVELGQALRDCVAVLAPRLEQAGVAVELDVAPGGLHVLVYALALQRALMNVITNAEQFSPAGGRIAVRAIPSGGGATVTVADEGPGIAEADRRRVFDMFYSARPGGTGLGLFLAKAAVERCGGSIRVYNRAERGACVEITLPLAQEVPHG